MTRRGQSELASHLKREKEDKDEHAKEKHKQDHHDGAGGSKQHGRPQIRSMRSAVLDAATEEQEAAAKRTRRPRGMPAGKRVELQLNAYRQSDELRLELQRRVEAHQ